MITFLLHILTTQLQNCIAKIILFLFFYLFFFEKKREPIIATIKYTTKIPTIPNQREKKRSFNTIYDGYKMVVLFTRN